MLGWEIRAYLSIRSCRRLVWAGSESTHSGGPVPPLALTQSWAAGVHRRPAYQRLLDVDRIGLCVLLGDGVAGDLLTDERALFASAVSTRDFSSAI